MPPRNANFSPNHLLPGLMALSVNPSPIGAGKDDAEASTGDKRSRGQTTSRQQEAESLLRLAKLVLLGGFASQERLASLRSQVIELLEDERIDPTLSAATIRELKSTLHRVDGWNFFLAVERRPS